LDLAFGLSESTEVFRIFSEGLIDQDIESERLHGLPLLTDAGNALVPSGKAWHNIHLCSFHHWLEALRFQTLQAMLARRLRFTPTRKAFQSILDQTLSDFTSGSEVMKSQMWGRENSQPFSAGPHPLI
jgi:hypothetical protein